MAYTNQTTQTLNAKFQFNEDEATLYQSMIGSFAVGAMVLGALVGGKPQNPKTPEPRIPKQIPNYKIASNNKTLIIQI